MRIALILLIGIHGIIHLFGFLKAFGLSAFTAMQAPMSKTAGLFWLLVCLLFAVTMVLIILRSEGWWMLGLVALIASQGLIFGYWTDAKFGTIANLVILLAVVVAYANHHFTQTVAQERRSMIQGAAPMDQTPISQEDIMTLPPVVQQWLINSGVVGSRRVSTVYLTQELSLRMSPEQSAWQTGSAEQYFTVQPPAFNWTINTSMNQILSVRGRDQYVDGKGEMQIKLLGLIPVANAQGDPKIDQATLQRYLAEIVWFPSAALSPYLQWEAVDSRSAKATMTLNGIAGSGVFHFDEAGTVQRFVAMRYQDAKAEAPTEWTITVTRSAVHNGIKIPTESEASWQLDTGSWTWLKLTVTHVEYNVEDMPVVSLKK